MNKEGYKPAFTGNTSVRIDLDSNGLVVTDTDTETAASTKLFTINKANADNDAADNNKLFKIFLGFTQSTFTDSTNQFTVKWEV